MKIRDDLFRKWKDETHIPKEVIGVVNGVCNYLGIPEPDIETISLRNRYGDIYGYAKGFVLTHCTFSYEDGPSIDYSDSLRRFIKGLGFEISASFGDNGMDSSTNFQDTFWHNEFVYSPSKVYKEEFIEWEEKDYVNL